MSSSSGHWLTWQDVLCGLIILGPVAAAAALLLFRVVPLQREEPPLRASDLWLPCWSGVHPLALLLYRGCTLVFMFAWFLRFFLANGASELLFYTQWTFALVTTYFAIATFISARGCWLSFKEESKKSEEAGSILDSDLETNRTKTDAGHVLGSYNMKFDKDVTPGFWGYAMQIVYQTSAGAAFLTDLTFWCLLVPFFYYDTVTLNDVTDGMHSLNLLFLLVDTFLNRMKFPWYGIIYFAFWSGAYIIFQWIQHACGISRWPYPFLDLDTPWAPLWYLALALFHVPCYFLYWTIVKAKCKFLPRFFPHAYSRSP